ncbi:MAG: (2Fe-2S)-binding protein [Actinomycetota bacterium]
MQLTLTINGRDHQTDVPVGSTLLQVLRDELRLTGTKEACVEGECGACTVLLDGNPLDSCIYLAHAAAGRSVTTVEGLVRSDGVLSDLQQAFLECGGVQCGFCTPGLLVTLSAFLDSGAEPTREAVTRSIVGNLCRCTGYSQVVDAVQLAAERRAAGR